MVYIIMDEMQTIELHALIEQWTRVEIMARLGQLGISSIDFARIKIDKENEIRKLLYGTSDLVALGKKWNLFKNEQVQAKENLKIKYQQLQKELAAMLKE